MRAIALPPIAALPAPNCTSGWLRMRLRTPAIETTGAMLVSRAIGATEARKC